jgi:hypothetical protein
MSRSARSHDHIEELIAARVLDGLDETGELELQDKMAAHGPGCPECAEMQRAYGEAASQLAVGLDPVAVSVGAEDRLLAAARTQALAAPRAAREPGRAVVEPLRPRRAWAGWRRWASAGAAAAVLAVAAGAVGYVLAPEAPSLRVLSFPPLRGEHVAVAYVPGTEQAVVVGTLPATPEGTVYELWYRPAGAQEMRPAGVFTPTNGEVNAAVSVGERFDLLAITIEPGFQQHPTTEPIATLPV